MDQQESVVSPFEFDGAWRNASGIQGLRLTVQHLESENAALQQTVQDVERKLEVVQAQLQEQSEYSSSVHEENLALRDELEHSQNEADRNADRLRAAIASVESKNAILRSQIEQVEQIETLHQRQLRANQFETSQLQSLLVQSPASAGMSASLADLEQQLASCIQERTEALHQVGQMKALLSAVTGENMDLVQQSETLYTRLRATAAYCIVQGLHRMTQHQKLRNQARAFRQWSEFRRESAWTGVLQAQRQSHSAQTQDHSTRTWDRAVAAIQRKQQRGMVRTTLRAWRRAVHRTAWLRVVEARLAARRRQRCLRAVMVAWWHGKRAQQSVRKAARLVLHRLVQPRLQRGFRQWRAETVAAATADRRYQQAELERLQTEARHGARAYEEELGELREQLEAIQGRLAARGARHIHRAQLRQHFQAWSGHSKRKRRHKHLLSAFSRRVARLTMVGGMRQWLRVVRVQRRQRQMLGRYTQARNHRTLRQILLAWRSDAKTGALDRTFAQAVEDQEEAHQTHRQTVQQVLMRTQVRGQRDLLRTTLSAWRGAALEQLRLRKVGPCMFRARARRRVESFLLSCVHRRRLWAYQQDMMLRQATIVSAMRVAGMLQQKRQALHRWRLRMLQHRLTSKAMAGMTATRERQLRRSCLREWHATVREGVVVRARLEAFGQRADMRRRRRAFADWLASARESRRSHRLAQTQHGAAAAQHRVMGLLAVVLRRTALQYMRSRFDVWRGAVAGQQARETGLYRLDRWARRRLCMASWRHWQRSCTETSIQRATRAACHRQAQGVLARAVAETGYDSQRMAWQAWVKAVRAARVLQHTARSWYNCRQIRKRGACFLAWREHIRSERRVRQVTSSVNERRRRDLMRRVLHHWQTDTHAARHSAALEQLQAVTQAAESKLAHELSDLQAQASANSSRLEGELVTATRATKAEAKKRFAAATATFFRNRKQRVLRGWQRTVRDTGKARRVLRRLDVQSRGRTLMDALGVWRRAALEEARRERLTRTVIRRLLHSRLNVAMRTWQTYVAAGLRAEASQLSQQLADRTLEWEQEQGVLETSLVEARAESKARLERQQSATIEMTARRQRLQQLRVLWTAWRVYHTRTRKIHRLKTMAKTSLVIVLNAVQKQRHLIVRQRAYLKLVTAVGSRNTTLYRRAALQLAFRDWADITSQAQQLDRLEAAGALPPRHPRTGALSTGDLNSSFASQINSSFASSGGQSTASSPGLLRRHASLLTAMGWSVLERQSYMQGALQFFQQTSTVANIFLAASAAIGLTLRCDSPWGPGMVQGGQGMGGLWEEHPGGALSQSGHSMQSRGAHRSRAASMEYGSEAGLAPGLASVTSDTFMVMWVVDETKSDMWALGLPDQDLDPHAETTTVDAEGNRVQLWAAQPVHSAQMWDTLKATKQSLVKVRCSHTAALCTSAVQRKEKIVLADATTDRTYHAATDIAVQAAAASPFPANMPLDESYISSFSAPQDRSLPGSPLRHLSPPRDGPDGVRSSGSSSVYMSPERVRDSPGRMSALPQVLSPGRVRPGYMVPSPPRMRYARSVGVRSHHSSPPRPGSVSPPMVVGGSAPMAGGGDPNGAISWDEHHDYLLEHFGVRCVTVPVVGTKGNVVAVLQVARRGGAEFAPSEVRQVEAVAQLVGLSLHRLSSAAVQRAARKQATSALEDAQKKLSTSAKKLRAIGDTNETLMKELARLRQHEAQLQQELVGTRVSTQREIDRSHRDAQRSQAHIAQLESRAVEFVQLQERYQGVRQRAERLESELQEKSKALEKESKRMQELQARLEKENRHASRELKGELQQAEADRDRAHTQAVVVGSELKRCVADATFLSTTLREMLEHGGRLSRSRLDEAMRVAARVDAKASLALKSPTSIHSPTKSVRSRLDAADAGSPRRPYAPSTSSPMAVPKSLSRWAVRDRPDGVSTASSPSSSAPASPVRALASRFVQIDVTRD